MGLFDFIPVKIINHRNFYLLGLAVLFSGIGWSNFLMSLGHFILIGNYLLEFDYLRKLKALASHKVILVLLTLPLLHLVGFLWSSDISYASKDLLNKAILFSLPIIVGTTSRLTNKEIKNLFLIYLSSILILSLISFSKYLGVFGENIVDKRKLSILISHIRYGLNIAMAIVIIFYYFKKYNPVIKVLLALMSTWLILCLFLFELTTGLVCLIAAGISIVGIRVWSHRTKPRLKIGILLVTIAISSFGINELSNIKSDFYSEVKINFDQEKTHIKTIQGNRYYHNLESDLKVNGVYLWRFIRDQELRTEWNKKSQINFDSSDLKQQPLIHTLVRFLSSKGLKKDSVGVNQLSKEEIKAIESGIAHVYYVNHNPIQNRVHKTIYEYENYTKSGVVNGFSLAMRLEYWKNSWQIVKENPIGGVGTGDIKNEIARNYDLNQSVLEQKYRKRTHNQYLTFWATFGTIGLLLFLFYLAYPLLKIESKNRRIYFVFLVIAGLSFVTEDTLETQAGVTFFALFNSLILLGFPLKK